MPTPVRREDLVDNEDAPGYDFDPVITPNTPLEYLSSNTEGSIKTFLIKLRSLLFIRSKATS